MLLLFVRIQQIKMSGRKKYTSINEDSNYVEDTSRIPIMQGVSIVNKLQEATPLTNSELRDLNNEYKIMYSLLKNKMR